MGNRTTMSLSEIYVKRQRAMDELSDLEKAEAEIKAQYKDLAMAMHNTLCSQNHTDVCGWDYEGNDWTSYAHAKWLKRAQAFMAECSESTEDELVALMGALKRSKSV